MTPRAAFLLRRLHSLTGVVPVGAFLVEHLWTNAAALRGRAAYGAAVEAIHAMPGLLAFEVLGIYAPLAFHAGYGVVLAFGGKVNVGRYPYGRNWLYFAQRATGFVVLAFVLFHLWEYRIQVAFFGMRPSAFYDTLAAELSATAGGVAWRALVYLAGIAASVFHFANGLWGFAATWGLAVTRPAQRRVAAACAGLGIALFLVGLASLAHFAVGSAPLLSAPDEPGGAAADAVRRTPCPTASAAP